MLRSILLYLRVCDGNLEEGSLRCDANVSVRPAGEKQFGTKVELKNLNSFRFIQKALEYEINRQAEVLQGGGKVVQESGLYDPTPNPSDTLRGREKGMSNDRFRGRGGIRRPSARSGAGQTEGN